MNDEHHEERPLQRLSFRERFEIRRAAYGGSAAKDPALAAVAVARARQLKARHRRWSRRWFHSFLLDPFDVPTYLVFSVFLLVVWPSLITVGILSEVSCLPPPPARATGERESASRRLPHSRQRSARPRRLFPSLPPSPSLTVCLSVEGGHARTRATHERRETSRDAPLDPNEPRYDESNWRESSPQPPTFASQRVAASPQGCDPRHERALDASCCKRLRLSLADGFLEAWERRRPVHR